MIAFEKGDRRMVALLEAIRQGQERLLIPATVLAQVWRDGARQARLAALVGDRRTQVEPLDRSSAKAAGVLCGLSKTRDIVDASVAVDGAVDMSATFVVDRRAGAPARQRESTTNRSSVANRGLGWHRVIGDGGAHVHGAVFDDVKVDDLGTESGYVQPFWRSQRSSRAAYTRSVTVIAFLSCVLIMRFMPP